ncbi:hypothetical protein PENTCL1PPCAC_20386, partial [Pristionchus entomophagus]
MGRDQGSRIRDQRSTLLHRDLGVLAVAGLLHVLVQLAVELLLRVLGLHLLLVVLESAPASSTAASRRVARREAAVVVVLVTVLLESAIESAVVGVQPESVLGAVRLDVVVAEASAATIAEAVVGVGRDSVGLRRERDAVLDGHGTVDHSLALDHGRARPPQRRVRGVVDLLLHHFIIDEVILQVLRFAERQTRAALRRAAALEQRVARGTDHLLGGGDDCLDDLGEAVVEGHARRAHDHDLRRHLHVQRHCET